MAAGEESTEHADIDLERMSEVDNLMWIVERNPLLKSTITAVTVLETGPDREVFEAKIERATRAIPRLRQRVVANPMSIAPPRWEVDPDFHLADHLHWVDLADEPDQSFDQVLMIAEEMAARPFDKTRPLWEYTMIVGVDDGSAAFVTKTHHSVADGEGSIQLMLEIFDLEPTEEVAGGPAAPTANPLNQADRVKNAIAHERDRQSELLRQLKSVVEDLPDSPSEGAAVIASTATSVGKALKPTPQPLSPLMSRRSLDVDFRTLTMPLEDLKAAGKLAGSKLNAAFVAGVIGGLRRYHDFHATPVEALRMGMPISTRSSADSATSNSFAATRLEVPLTIEDPIELMRHLDELVAEAREDPSVGATQYAAGVLRLLPKRLTTELMAQAMKGVDFSTSNVPGVPVPVYLSGSLVLGQYPFGPLSGSGVNITLLSYRDEVFLGINMDRAAIPDGDEFHNALQVSFDEVLGLA